MLYYTGSAYAKAKADVVSTAEIVGMVSRVLDANTFEVTLEGKVTGLSGLTAGTTYFLSASTAGAITATEPSTLGYVSLPVGVAISTTVIYVRTSRGAVVGSVNARTEIALANNTTTNVQSVSAYQAGELSGWVEIDGTTDLKFFVSAPFAKNGANSDYYISPSYVGDTPPVGFSLSITSGGLIQATLPSIAGYVSAKINFALNAPAVGATFPLSIDSTLVQFSTLKAKDSGGFVFQENGGTQIGSWSDTGALTVGPIGFTGIHTTNSGVNYNFTNNPQSSQTTIAGYNNSIIQFTANTGNSDRTGIFGTASGLPVGIGFERVNSGNWQTDICFKAHPSTIAGLTTLTEIGRGTGEGAWILGSDTATANTHQFWGIQTNVVYTALSNGQTSGYQVLATNGGNQRKAYIGVYKHAGITYPTGFISMDLGNDSVSVPYYLWFENVGGKLMTSGTASNVGTTSGVVVGDQTSDERLKTGIYDTTYGLDTVLNLRPINFSMHGKNQVGFSAQHTRMFLPEAVYDTGEVIVEGHENKLAMQYVQIIPVLTKAIQELSAKVTALESQLN
jgi:hypothetical protein